MFDIGRTGDEGGIPGSGGCGVDGDYDEVSMSIESAY